MHTKEQLTALATRDPSLRKDLILLCRAYGLSSAEIVRMENKERIDKILELQETQGYLPIPPALHAGPESQRKQRGPTVRKDLAKAKRAADAILRILAADLPLHTKRRRIRVIARRLDLAL